MHPRHIAQPSREIKAVQRWIVSRALSKLPLHDAATAYRPKIGIRKNAEHHAGARVLLKMDFSNFFPSIDEAAVRLFLSSSFKDILRDEVELLVGLLVWRRPTDGVRCLAIGAPSSPELSNRMLHSLDVSIASHCSQNGVSYTRYADDMVFGCKDEAVARGVLKAVTGLVRALPSPRLVINDAKTRLVLPGMRKYVTGLVIQDNGTVGLGRDRRRILRAMAHHASVEAASTPEEVAVRCGWLAYAHSIEPSFVDKLRNRFGAEDGAGRQVDS